MASRSYGSEWSRRFESSPERTAYLARSYYQGETVVGGAIRLQGGDVVELSRISLTRVAVVTIALLAVGLALIALPATKASAATSDCTLTVSGPFFYADMV